MKHDGYKAGRLLIDNSKNSNIEGADAFCNGVQKIIDDGEDEAYFEHIGDYVTQICNLAREHSVRLDPAYFQIAMALKVMEGVALSLNKVMICHTNIGLFCIYCCLFLFIGKCFEFCYYSLYILW
jgi:predicted unusual protein kinase regulating ubiquinone biosynthesis (AarF/ABC1/UbiB family)